MLKSKIMILAGLLTCIIGCSMMGKNAQRTVIGSWTGQTAQGAFVTFTFREDNSMSLVFDMDGNEFSLNFIRRCIIDNPGRRWMDLEKPNIGCEKADVWYHFCGAISSNTPANRAVKLRYS